MDDNSNQKAEYTFKYIIVGNAAVGKSNISYRFTKGKFLEKYHPTIGLDFTYKILKIRDKMCKIQIWDTAGQECFKSISRGYYKSSVCALVVYDITDKESFKNVETWVEECKNNSPKTVTMVLVGNKSDLNNNRVITTEEGAEFASRFDMQFYETSAFDGTNIDKLFSETSEKIVEKMENNYYDLTDEECGIKVGTGNKRNVLKKDDSTKKKKCPC